MTAAPTPAVEIRDLHKRYGRSAEAVRGLSLTVAPGRCHGLFGRNGAGKSTTMKCLLNHLRPDRGTLRVFGIDPRRDEVAVKTRVGYVPEVVAFHPWMSARGVLDYAASFRKHWNRELERDLLGRFRLSEKTVVSGMSKGMRSQLALVCAICPEPDLLLLDEPTSGLDPIVRREFLETVIGAYQEGAPGRRTVLVSTHMIGEFEGLLDEFTIVQAGRAVATFATDDARRSHRRVMLRYEGDPPERIEGVAPLQIRREGRDLEVVVGDWTPAVEAALRATGPTEMNEMPLGLEEIFVQRARSAEEADDAGGASAET